MEENEQKQHLLYEEDMEASSNHGDIPLSHRHLQSLKANALVLILLVLSFGINAVFFSIYFFKDTGFSSRYGKQSGQQHYPHLLTCIQLVFTKMFTQCSAGATQHIRIPMRQSAMQHGIVSI
jgi:hypothetical protein